MIDIIQEVQLNKIVKLCVVTVDKFYVNNDDIELPVYHEHWNILKDLNSVITLKLIIKY